MLSIVSVCVNYGDFLYHSAQWNRIHADNYIVVTTPTDIETREVCRQLKLTCLTTDDDKRDGEFSKSRLLERGLNLCGKYDWILVLDSDIVLPATFKDKLDLANLDENKIYGCDRFMVRSFQEWQKLITDGWSLDTKFYGHPHGVLPPTGLPLGARWVSNTDGWCPLGYFQLYNRKADEWRGTRVRPYIRNHGAACRTDAQFSLQWDRNKRELLGEFFVAHLDSEKSETGKNWNGRKTPRFGPPLFTSNNNNNNIS